MASIHDLYLQILGRPADPSGRQFYEQQLASGAKTETDIIRELQGAVASGQEDVFLNKTATQQATAAYKSVLGREPDMDGLGFYAAKNINEGNAAVINDLVYSQEGQQVEQAKIQARRDEQKKINDAAVARTATKVAERNNQLADTLQKTLDIARQYGDTNTVNRLTDQIARLRGQTTDTTGTGTTGVDPNRVQAVSDVYRNVYYREPDAEGLAFYTTGGGKDVPINELAGVLQNEPEGKQVANVASMYKDYFGRDPDAEGIRYYRDLFGETIDPSEIVRFIDTGRQQSTETLTPNALSFLQNFNNINPLYTDYLGRPASFEEIQSYASQFGETIDPGEREAFIRGGLSSGELTQDRFNELLASLTSNSETPGGETPGGGTPGGGTPGGGTSTVGALPGLAAIPAASKFLSTGATSLGITDPNFLRTSPTSAVRPILGLTGLPTTSQNIQNLYQSYLGRTPSPQEVAIQQQIMGPVISPLKAYDFTGAVEQELAGAQGPRNFGGASLLVSPSLTAPNAPAPVTPVESRAGGMINYQEGGDVEGGMAKATPAELGSKFDISEFVDEQGRLVSGYSRPIRDEFGVIVGYEDRPYEENVVFGEKLRERQAAAPLDSERAMLDMLARQGRTGVDPMTGGLAGIQVGGPMMRNMPQYYSTIEAGRRYRGMAKGGLADIADDMSDMGRGEDTMLLHVSPEEVRGLDAVARSMMGTGLTINPYTGLPEADIFNEIGKLFKKVAKPFAKVLPFILPFTPLGPLAQGLISGLTTGLASGDAKKGLFSGLATFGAANLTQGAQAAAQTGADAAAQTAAQAGADAATQAAGQAATQAGVDAASQAGAQAGLGALSAGEISAAGLKSGANYGSLQGSFLDRAGSAVADSFSKGLDISGIPGRVADTVKGVGNLAFSDAAGRQAAAEAAKAGMSVSPTTAAATTFMGMSGEAARDTELAAERENAALFAEKEDKEKRFRELAQRLQQQYPFEYAKGGLTSLARGGMTYMEAGGTTGPTGTPREVVGNGDGMSDSIPADIEGVQEARLADGEFVVPADVVADIGNGSSDAGSKKLYDMMDRIRMARHGTKKQPPEINAERLMPA